MTQLSEPEELLIAGLNPAFGSSTPDAGHAQSHAAAHKPIDRRFVTASLMIVMVLASMEQTVTSTAMPTIIGQLHGLQHYSWVASIYLLACTVSMPMYGRLSDALGRKRVILVAIGLFIGSSVLAATAKSMLQLILYRGLQGLGAGGIMPIVLTILGDIFTLEERARIQGLFSAVWGTASLAGPALGAMLVNSFGWRSIFFVNLPFGLLGIVVLAWKYHDPPRKNLSSDFDLPGAVTLTIACTAFLSFVSGFGSDGWSTRLLTALAMIAVVFGFIFVRHEIHAPAPIMPPKLMVRRSIGPSMLGSCLLGIAFLSLDTYVPLYVQGARGGGATAAAGVVTPVMLMWALSGIAAAPLVVRYGFRRIALLGTSLVMIGFTGLLLGAIYHWSSAALTAVLALTGLGFGPASMSYLLAAQDAVTWEHRGVITGGVQFFRTMGGAIGIGLLGGLFNALTRSDMAGLRAMGVSTAALLDVHPHVAIAPATLAMARASIGHGLVDVFAAMLAMAVLGVIVSSLMSGKRQRNAVRAEHAMEAFAG